MDVTPGGERPPAQESLVSGAGGSPSASLSVHALNVLTGLPASGLAMRLSRLEDPGEAWTELMKSTTSTDGRLDQGGPGPQQLRAGTYKLRFATGEYWHQQGQPSFYPYVEVVFSVVEAERKVHIPCCSVPIPTPPTGGN